MALGAGRRAGIVTARGCCFSWPPTRLLQSLLRAHLLHKPPALDSPVAFFLRVDVTGMKGGDTRTVSFQSSHPTDWGPAGTARMTGIPASIGLQALAHGEVARNGVLGPEAAFEPGRFFEQLGRRGIAVVPA